LLALATIGGRHQHRAATLRQGLITEHAEALGAEGQSKEVSDRTERHIQGSILHLRNGDGIAVEVNGAFALGHEGSAVRLLRR
jgi:hypothetical protein